MISVTESHIGNYVCLVHVTCLIFVIFVLLSALTPFCLMHIGVCYNLCTISMSGRLKLLLFFILFFLFFLGGGGLLLLLLNIFVADKLVLHFSPLSGNA